RGAARQRAGHDHFPQAHRRGAGHRARAGDDRQPQVARDRGGAQMRFGQAARPFEFNAAGRGVASRARALIPSVRSRGCRDGVRRAMRTLVRYRAIPAGMDMGIVNAGQLDVYDAIDPELREACEDVILDRRDDATERLIELAERYKGTDEAEEKKLAEWRSLPVTERLSYALVKGIDAH